MSARGVLWPAVLLSACGGSSYRIDKNAYSAQPSASVVSVAAANGAVNVGDLAGVAVTLTSDPDSHRADDPNALQVTLLWPANAPPPLGREVAMDGSYYALVALSCACTGLAKPSSAPQVTGKFRLELNDVASGKLRGSFSLTFHGDLPLLSGGVALENSTVMASSDFATR